jgi:hypothetical protein
MQVRKKKSQDFLRHLSDTSVNWPNVALMVLFGSSERTAGRNARSTKNYIEKVVKPPKPCLATLQVGAGAINYVMMVFLSKKEQNGSHSKTTAVLSVAKVQHLPYTIFCSWSWKCFSQE